MGVTMMVMYQGRMMTTEEVLKIRNNTKVVIETPNITPKVEEKKEVIESPEVETPEIVADELDELRNQYKKLFGRKPHPSTGIETLRDKISEASKI